MVDALSSKLTMMIKANDESIDDKKAEIINYGLQCFFSCISKIALIFLISYFLGIFNLVIISTLSFGFYRLFAGGVHSNTHIGCFILTSAILIGSVYIAKYTSFYYGKMDLLFIGIFIINLIIIYIYAPADVKQKPILKKALRKRMRIGSFISMSLLVLLALAIRNPLVSNLIVIVAFLESLTMLPVIYKLLRCEYGYRRYAESV